MRKPPYLDDAHLAYLDKLRESGETNMFLAGPYIMKTFPELDERKAKGILTYWMQTFVSRHKE